MFLRGVIDKRLDTQVGDQVRQYVRGALTLREFQVWFAPIAWSLGQDRVEVHPLARRVELRLAEYTNGDWTERDLRDELSRLVSPARPAVLSDSIVTHWKLDEDDDALMGSRNVA